ncbi:hypothetical protein ElyMa_000681600 [Elysia marginata]|uniref:Uncharacterized protein n=1 Tax=Elysia marginata TaxID=1093978 RepID=A0AAV4GHR1_9GAST|nr:hypothetical protein ElyMa_000681600 [Elysia marginata]
MRYGPAQEDEAGSGGNTRWLMGYGLRQPIACCKIQATYGCYYLIRYRRRRARSLQVSFSRSDSHISISMNSISSGDPGGTGSEVTNLCKQRC